MVELFHRWRDAGPDSPLTRLRLDLEAASKVKKSDSAALACARRAASGALSQVKADLGLPSSGNAVVRVVEELRADPRPMTARAFTEELDRWLMRREFSNAY